MPPDRRRLACLMFADMVGFSTLAQKDEARALELLDEQRKLVEPLFAEHGGTAVKSMGDGCLVEFPSAVGAARCAVAVQNAVHLRNEAVGPERRFELRIGLHVGDVVVRGEDLFGDGVNLASRIEACAPPGGICLTDAVAQQIENKIDLPVVAVGSRRLKNIDRPVALYRIALPWGPPVEAEPAAEREAPAGLRRWAPRAIGALGVAALAALGWWALVGKGSSTTLASGIRSIAVLPLEDMSHDPEQEYFADGMTEALTTELSKIGALSVISRSSTNRYKGTTKPLPEIAKELNVQAVVEGSVLRAGERVRITAQLIHAGTDTHLWAESYEGDLADVLRLQSEVARAIAREIEVAMTPEEAARLASSRPVDPEAYEAYLKGMFHLNKLTPEGFEKGLNYLHEAVEKDPGNALTYAGLAWGYSFLGSHSPNPPPDAFERAQAAYRKALELDPTVAEAHAAVAERKFFQEHDWEGAEESYRRAFELNPSLAAPRVPYAWYLNLFDRQEEAVAQMRRAIQLDPLTSNWAASLADLHSFGGDYDQALIEVRRAFELDPDLPAGYGSLGGAYAGKGMYEEAIEATEKAVAGDSSRSWQLGQIYAQAGRTQEARRIAAELEADPDPLEALGLALIYTALGEKDQAFRWLAHEPAHPWILWIRIWPGSEPLHDDPRFLELLDRMDLPPPERKDPGAGAAREVTEAGDDFLALFDDPARAIACAHAIRDRGRELGLEIRCGLHMGQAERNSDGSAGGITVHFGARVAGKAAPGEVLVTSAVPSV